MVRKLFVFVIFALRHALRLKRVVVVFGSETQRIAVFGGTESTGARFRIWRDRVMGGLRDDLPQVVMPRKQTLAFLAIPHCSSGLDSLECQSNRNSSLTVQYRFPGR